MRDLSDILELYPETWKNANTYYLKLAGGVLVDPGAPMPDNISEKPAFIFATHCHYDHLRSLESWLGEASCFACAEADRWMLEDSEANASKMFANARTFPQPQIKLVGGDELALDDQFSVEVWATPGHTEGGICLLLQEKKEGENQPLALFTGDTIFADNIGRSDLIGGDPAKMRASLLDIKKRLRDLPLDLPLLPGHGPLSRVEEVLAINPFLRDKGLLA